MKITGPEKLTAARRLAALTTTAVILLAACGSNAPSPYEIVNDYLNTLAEGDYPSACAMLTARARAAMSAATGVRGTCVTVLARCLPNHALVLKEDQSQLFYANVSVTTQGSIARAAVSGTAVANAIRKVGLQKTRAGWTLSSSGSGLNRCTRRHGARG